MERTRKCRIAKEIFWPIWDVPLLVWKPRGGPRAKTGMSVVMLCLFTSADLVRGFRHTHFALHLKMTSLTALILFPFFKCFSTSLALLIPQSRVNSLTILMVQTELKFWVTFMHQTCDGNGFLLWEYDLGLWRRTFQCAWVEPEDFNCWRASFNARSSHFSSISTPAILWSWEQWFAGRPVRISPWTITSISLLSSGQNLFHSVVNLEYSQFSWYSDISLKWCRTWTYLKISHSFFQALCQFFPHFSICRNRKKCSGSMLKIPGSLGKSQIIS